MYDAAKREGENGFTFHTALVIHRSIYIYDQRWTRKLPSMAQQLHSILITYIPYTTNSATNGRSALHAYLVDICLPLLMSESPIYLLFPLLFPYFPHLIRLELSSGLLYLYQPTT